MFLSPFVLQKVCILQHSSDSVQKPVGPNNDVQKYYTITVSEVLPGCVASKFCFYYYALFIYFIIIDLISVSLQMMGSKYWWMWKGRTTNKFHNM